MTIDDATVPQPSVLEAALAWHDAGYSVRPITANGEKRPVGQWKKYQFEQPTRDRLLREFSGGHPGVGLICGAISGGLELFELEGRALGDDGKERLEHALSAAGLYELWELLTEKGYAERSPSGGLHLLYRITDHEVPGNTKIAVRPADTYELTSDEIAIRKEKPDKVFTRVLAETRGEGGFVVVAPSHGPVHPTGRAWCLNFGSQPGVVPTIYWDERQALHAVVRDVMHEMPERATPRKPAPAAEPKRLAPAAKPSTGELRPGDDWARQTSWRELLEPHGHVLQYSQGTEDYWRRSGKDTGISFRTGGDFDGLYCWSTSAEFPTEEHITKFRAYAILEHGGDDAAAARALTGQGFGSYAAQAAKVDSYVAGLPASQPRSTAVAVATPQTATRRLVLTAASDIEPEPVVWAWEDTTRPAGTGGRIPRGSLSIAAGREGTGKSSFGIWLAANITCGTLPGTLDGDPHCVIYAAVEDSWKYTLVPRLMAAGADLTKVFRVEVFEDDAHGTTLSLPTDNVLLHREILRTGTALLVLDPLMSTIGAGIDTHRERDVRTALDPLARLADETHCVVLGIAHFNKGSGTDPSSLITGSGAFKNVPRSVFGFAIDPEAGRVMSQTKNSLGRLDLPSLKYEIESTNVDTKTGVTQVGHFVWLGESDRSVTDILADRDDGDERAERDEAAQWLRTYLEDQGGEAAFKDLIKAARADGLAEHTMRRARTRAGVDTVRIGFPSSSVWRLQSEQSPDTADRDSKPVSSVSTVSPLDGDDSTSPDLGTGQVRSDATGTGPVSPPPNVWLVSGKPVQNGAAQ